MESFEVDESFVAENMQSDLTLIVETHKIRVCKAVLCIASPVFRAMLMGDFKEKQLEEIEMPGKSYQNVVLFLRCIYPDKLEYLTAKTVYNILPLASEYQVQVLEDRCHRIILEIVTSKHLTNAMELFRHIQLAELYSLEELRQKCISIASEFLLKQMNEGNGSYEVSEKSMREVKDLALKRYQLNAEDDKFLFATCGNTKKTLKEAIRQTIQNARWDDNKENKIRARRLYMRYFPDDVDLRSCVEDTCSPVFNAGIPFVGFVTKQISEEEQLKLLPERLKQLLKLENTNDSISKALCESE